MVKVFHFFVFANVESCVINLLVLHLSLAVTMAQHGCYHRRVANVSNHVQTPKMR